MSSFAVWDIPRGTIILLGVVGTHDDEVAGRILDAVTAWMMTHPSISIMATGMSDDCLVAPPERGDVHVELRWLSV
jgi:hypothetical protein